MSIFTYLCYHTAKPIFLFKVYLIKYKEFVKHVSIKQCILFHVKQYVFEKVIA